MGPAKRAPQLASRFSEKAAAQAHNCHWLHVETLISKMLKASTD